VQKLPVFDTFLICCLEIPEAHHLLNEWNVRISKQLLDVEGREIIGPTLQFSKTLELKNPGPEFTIEAHKACLEPVNFENRTFPRNQCMFRI
jgi:hypothetical protein